MKKNILSALLLTGILGVSGLQAQAPQLPYRPTLDVVLSENGTVESAPAAFQPGSDFSVEFPLQIAAGSSAALHLSAANASGKGVALQFTESAVTDAAGVTFYAQPANDGASHTYRLALAGTAVHLYRDGVWVAQGNASTLGEPYYQYLCNEADATGSGIYASGNLVANPGFETEGTVLTNSGTTYKFWPAGWNIANANTESTQAMGVRCNKDDATYANGREGSSALMFRQDGSGGFTAASGSYVYQKLAAPLKAGRKYLLTFQALSHTNDLGKTYAVGVGTAQGTWDCLYTTWTAPTEKQTLQTYQYEFIAPATVGESAYLAFICYGSTGICHLDRVVLEEASGLYNTFTATAEGSGLTLGATTYSPVALSPEANITNTILAGGEYHLYHTDYARVLGQKADATSPGLSVWGTNADETYVFVAEASGTEGYYLLHHKSSGRYLTVSTSSSNTWTVYLTEGRSTADHYLWKLNGGTAGSIISKYNGKYLGCDAGSDANDYVSVYYDKAAGSYSTWQIVEAAFPLDEARLQLYKSELTEVMTISQAILNNTAYPDASKTVVDSLLQVAEGEIAVATIADAARLTELVSLLEEANTNCFADNAVTWFTGSYFAVGDRYTVALKGVSRSDRNGDVSLIVRNTKGKGAILTLSATSVSAGGTTLPYTYTDEVVLPTDYQFAFNGTQVDVYADGVLLGNLPVEEVPARTAAGTDAEFSVMGLDALNAYRAEVVSETAAVAPGDEVLNAYGKAEVHTFGVVNQTIELDTPVDFHIFSESAPLSGSTINLTSEDAWVIFDNTLPSTVISSYLSRIKVNGAAASNGKNVRVAIYLNGAVVIPHASTYKPFVGYTGELYTGEATEYKVGNISMGKAANTFSGFILKRGYMVCLATESDGGGYSRVYVADHEDILVPVLPDPLYRRISYVNIKKWNYVSKKGWCSTNGSTSIATECRKTRSTWFYTWSADRSSTYDTEYVPIKQHLYWPSWSQINGLSDCTHVLGFNEPEHSEQHTSDQCSCGGVISEWSACTKTPDFQESGMRIGSPAPTDAGWLKNYVGHCDDMAYRLDFVVMHCYWGTNEAADAKAWYNQLKSIYDNTKRPIWITEWNNGASWTTESWPDGYGEKLEKNRKAIKEILHVLDTCSFVERYSIYNWDSYYRAMINEEGWVTPAGEVYRDNKPTFAYNAKVQYIPHWWAPSLKEVSCTGSLLVNSGRRVLMFKIDNPNTDMTDRLVVQHKSATGWVDAYEMTDRYKFDDAAISYNVYLDDETLDGEQTYRVVVKTHRGETATSDEFTINVTTGLEETLGDATAPAIWQQGSTVYVRGEARKAALYAMDGSLVEVYDLAEERTIDVSSLSRGFYLLKTDRNERFTVVVR